MRPTKTNSTQGRHTRRHAKLTLRATGLGVCLLLLLGANTAIAQDFTFHTEAAAAFSVDEPQSDRFTPAFYFALRPGIALGSVVALQWSYAALLAPAGKGFEDFGVAHFVMAGLRLRPFAPLQPEEDKLGGLFVDFNLGYVRTGDLDRFGFDAGLGYNFQATPWMSFGPVVRYGQIVQDDNTPNVDPNDLQFVTAGLSMSFGPAYEPPVEYVPPPCPTCPQCPECPNCPDCPDCPDCPKCPEVVAQVVAPLGPDWDGDGILDDADRCPTQKGPPETWGCPIDPCNSPLMVSVHFEFDSSKLPAPRDDDAQTMDPVLDAVAVAIGQNEACRVCIVGYASDEGDDKYNLKLSTERAAAVQGYMTARGLAQTRIPSTGLGEACQIVPPAGRPLNRRVEFRRLDEGQSCPTTCAE